MIILRLLLITIFLTVPSISSAKTGKGDVKLSKETMEYIMVRVILIIQLIE